MTNQIKALMHLFIQGPTKGGGGGVVGVGREPRSPKCLLCSPEPDDFDAWSPKYLNTVKPGAPNEMLWSPGALICLSWSPGAPHILAEALEPKTPLGPCLLLFGTQPC